MFAIPKQPKAEIIIEDYPTIDYVGNDDCSLSDEDSNYTQDCLRDYLFHLKGEMSAYDAPGFHMTYESIKGEKFFENIAQFQSFTRLQLGNQQKWYLTSDYLDWYFQVSLIIKMK